MWRTSNRPSAWLKPRGACVLCRRCRYLVWGGSLTSKTPRVTSLARCRLTHRQVEWLNRVCNSTADLREGVLNGISDEEEFATLRFQHAFVDAVIQEDQEFVVEAVDVEQENGLCVNFEGVPRENLEKLFKRA